MQFSILLPANGKAGSLGYKTFSTLTHLNMEFSLLINVKMPTIVGILTFISRTNTSLIFRARKIFIIQHLIFYEQLTFYAQLG